MEKNKKLIKYLSLWIPTIVWAGVIFYLSSIPKLEAIHDPLWNLITRKLGHIGVYFVLFLLLNRSFENKKPILAVYLALLYAISDEYHQSFVPLRKGDHIDVIIDLVGILGGYYWFKKIRKDSV
ncbi:MAG: hypothetical protein A3J50_03175 [Candidatus Woykebacteria bacterium RIFCSPHIGHO2_02_FULL_43_16b]|uniref:VanZ-like domain-containing protein n=1 Tax=Candidatus Woykebacteria bacterium RIFCSPHIGHO2_02_FULL_43_16b TaxID=1802601 RepID=A0A1G1WSZ5_9BACT|nr:MAG: hypothetical protein A3J50_03175 [Candidatus Woykebacteria bacterium RIFCSPHIGHO2_02_FULL_43_16b]